jgi:acetate kinase
MEATMEGKIEVAECRDVEERWNEEARCALEAIITRTQDRITQTRALIAKIDKILAKRG